MYAVLFILTNSYGNLIVAYLYERCITVGQEVEHIWRRRISAASALYLLLQLSTVTMFVLDLVQQLIMLDCNVSPGMLGHSGAVAHYCTL